MIEAERVAAELESHSCDPWDKKPMLKAAALLRSQAAEIERLKVAMNQWLDKTEWVQETAQPQELGMHRADVLRNRIDALRTQLAAEQADYRKALDRITDLECELGHALSQLAAAQADAARYRWLRERDDWMVIRGMRNGNYYLRSDLDEQIDLSMGVAT